MDDVGRDGSLSGLDFDSGSKLSLFPNVCTTRALVPAISNKSNKHVLKRPSSSDFLFQR